MNPASRKNILIQHLGHPFPEVAIQRVERKNVHLNSRLLQSAHVAGKEGADFAGELVGEYSQLQIGSGFVAKAGLLSGIRRAGKVVASMAAQDWPEYS